MTFPCQDCPDRKLGCHDVCEKYLEVRKRKRDLDAARREEKLMDRAIEGNHIARTRRRRSTGGR